MIMQGKTVILFPYPKHPASFQDYSMNEFEGFINIEIGSLIYDNEGRKAFVNNKEFDISEGVLKIFSQRNPIKNSGSSLIKNNFGQ